MPNMIWIITTTSIKRTVGRGHKRSYCILMFKSNLSENAKKRINILKKILMALKYPKKI